MSRAPRDWSVMDPVQYFKDQYGPDITSRTQLKAEDNGLYQHLLKSGKLDEVLDTTLHNWSQSDPVQYFEKHYAGKITSRAQLEKQDNKLYQALRTRQLLDRLLPSTHAGYRDFDHIDPVLFFKETCAGKITSRAQLKKKDQGLYRALRKRQLLDQLLPSRHTGRRDFEQTDPVQFFKETYAGKIASRAQLSRQDKGLYAVLLARQLLDQLLPNKNGNHRDYDQTDPVRYFQEQYGGKITSKVQLKKEDNGLYQALRTRKLLDVVFPAPDERRKLERLLQDYADGHERAKMEGLFRRYLDDAAGAMVPA